MIRARIQHNNKEYALGTFQTKKEVNAAKGAATRILDRVDVPQPAPVKPRPPAIPSLGLVTNLVDMGVYDRDDESIMVLISKLVKRYRMVTDGVQNATPPVQTMTLDEIVEISGAASIREDRGPLLPQSEW